MTSEQIETAVERKFDRLDARLMRGEVSQVEYDAEAKAISIWADEQYGFITKGLQR